MTIDDIKKAWVPKKLNAKSGIDWWNSKAEQFSSKDLPTPATSLGMRIIQQENMVYKGCSTLDVGCGGGRFSFALEQMGAAATATDFSPKMIEAADRQRVERSSTVSFSVDNWHTLDLNAKNWNKKFDLVLANMTPAIVSADTFLKLSDASRTWCLMVKPARRSNSILDELNRIVGAEKDTIALDETIAYAFELLWLKGFSPKLEYENQVWENDMTLEEAIKEYTLRIGSMHDLSEENTYAIRAYLESIAVDGMIHEISITLIVAMYWKVV